MAKFDKAVVILNKENFNGYKGNPPTNEIEYNSVKDEMFSANPPTWQEITSTIQKLEDKETNIITAKASAKTKLLNLGLTEDEIKALIGV